MKRFLKGLGIFLSLVTVGVVSAFAVMALLLRQEEVKVPDLTGQDLVATIEMLNQRGLQLKIERREPHPTLPRDTVVSQIPAAGNGIKKGRPVRVIVSQGPSESLTPKLVGEHYRKAEVIIRQAGSFPAVSRVSSNTVQRDTVIAQDPPAETTIEKGGRVSILVSSGRKQQTFVMPRLIGKKAEEALKVIDRMGMQCRLVYKTPGNKGPTAERAVISQKPGAGYPVTADSSAELVISK